MPNRFLLLTPIAAAALLMPGGAFAITAVQVPPSMCGNEPMPEIEAPYKMVCALDQGVVADSSHDQGDNIRAALERLAASDTGLYFPQGRYVVAGNLPLRTGNVLVGSRSRSGVTHFLNPRDQTSSITQTFHSANNILVEGLVLDNIAIRFSHQGTSVIRYNGLRGVTSDQAQVTTIGGDRIVGNVLWRDAAHPGIGIFAFRGSNARISGNLLGSDASDPSALLGRTPGPDKRTERLAHAMTRLADKDGTAPVAGQSRSHFTTAIQVDGSAGTRIFGNAVAVAATRAGSEAPDRRVALLKNATDLRLQGNRFVAQGDAATSPVPLVVQAPQDMDISRNTLDRVGMQLVPDDKTQRATKRTLFKKNLLVNATVDVTQPVTGDDEASTTINDLAFVSNLFDDPDPTQCLIDAPIPSQPGRTFGARGNLRIPGNLPAKTCNLRDTSPTITTVPPAVLIPGSRTDAQVPTGQTGDADSNVSTPPAPERKPSWRKRAVAWIKRELDRVF